MRLIHMQLATESEAKLVYKEPPFVIDDESLWLFQGVLVEDNIVSECIRTVAATYGCKILQMYKYEAKCEW